MAEESIQTPHVSLLRYSTSAVLWINGSSLNQTETVEPEVTVMDFGIDGCYSQRTAEIRNKVWKLRVERSEVK
jgi:hypothetical protein